MAKVALRFGCAKQSKKSWKVSKVSLLLSALSYLLHSYCIFVWRQCSFLVEWETSNLKVRGSNPTQFNKKTCFFFTQIPHWIWNLFLIMISIYHNKIINGDRILLKYISFVMYVLQGVIKPLQGLIKHIGLSALV